MQDFSVGALMILFQAMKDLRLILLSLTIAKSFAAPPGPTRALATPSSIQVRKLKVFINNHITTTNTKHVAQYGHNLR